MTVQSRYPNCCPFCGTHVNRGGVGQRHTVFHCGNCHADYSVAFYGTYRQEFEGEFEEKYQRFFASVPSGIAEMRDAIRNLGSDPR